MATTNSTQSPRHSEYEWGELWEGTKTQMQAVGIGIGVKFPGEPGGPKRSVKTTNHRGDEITIAKEVSDEEGIYRAQMSYRKSNSWERSSLLGPEQFAPGVVVIRDTCGYDEYKGSADALVAAGVIDRNKLPGMPGRGTTMTSFNRDGSARAVGSSSGDHCMVARRNGKDRFSVTIYLGDEERERRKPTAEVVDARWVRENATARQKRYPARSMAAGDSQSLTFQDGRAPNAADEVAKYIRSFNPKTAPAHREKVQRSLQVHLRIVFDYAGHPDFVTANTAPNFKYTREALDKMMKAAQELVSIFRDGEIVPTSEFSKERRDIAAAAQSDAPLQDMLRQVLANCSSSMRR